MPSETSTNWINILSALLTPTIAIFVSIIAGMQWRINQKRLKNEHFDRRIKIYERIAGCMADVITSGRADINEERSMLRDSKFAIFVFGEDIDRFVKEVYQKSSDLHTLQSMQHKYKNKQLENNLNKQDVIKNWFKTELVNLPKRFEKYLKL